MSSPQFNIQIQQNINTNNNFNINNNDNSYSYLEAEKDKENLIAQSNSFRLNNENNKENTIKNIFSPIKNKNFQKGKEKQVTSIVIEKSNGRKISEIKVKYEKDKVGNNILIKFSDEISKDKKKTRKEKEKLRLVDDKGKEKGGIEEEDKKRVDFFGNPIKKKGKQKIFFKNEVEVVKIKSIKTLLPSEIVGNIICKCGCSIY